MHQNAIDALRKLQSAGVRFCIGTGFALNSNNTSDIDLSVHPADYDLVKATLPEAREFYYAPAKIKKIVLSIKPFPLDMYFGCVLPEFEYGKVETTLEDNGFPIWTQEVVRRYYEVRAGKGNLKARMKLEKNKIETI